jgi:hypothetical protein
VWSRLRGLHFFSLDDGVGDGIEGLPPSLELLLAPPLPRRQLPGLAGVDLLLRDLRRGSSHGVAVHGEVVLGAVDLPAGAHRAPVQNEDAPRELVLPLAVREGRLPF